MNDKEDKTFFEKYKNYIEVFTVLLVVTCSIACFLPICNGTYDEYLALLEPNPDIIDEEEANKIKEEAQNTTINNVTDTLEVQREIEDVVNGFFYDLKSLDFNSAYNLLGEESFSSQDNSIKYNIEYNKDFAFFSNYLKSFEVSINQVTVLDEIAAVNLTINRFDINRMINKLISEKTKNGDDDSNKTYETILFEYENYLKEEFQKTNPYMKSNDYLIGLSKDTNGTWKLVNDDDLNTNGLNLEFKIAKNEE